MRYETLISMFDKYINKPHDYTDSFWYNIGRSEIHYSAQDETSKNPDNWISCGYTSYTKEVTDKKGYRIVTLDDGCGGEFQAFFKLSMKIDPEEFD